MSTWSDVLIECRRLIGDPPRDLSPWRSHTYMKIAPPDWLRENPEDKLSTHFKNYTNLLKHGVVVWGHIIQANRLLFEPGVDDCPGELIFCLDEQHRGSVQELADCARQLFSLKGTSPDDPSLMGIAEYLTDEYTRVFGLEVPAAISGHGHRISSTFFVRKHMPTGVLRQPLLPLLVLPEEPFVATVLPSKFWSEDFHSFWLDE